MRAIFAKEWRQAHLLPWAGLLISAMMMVLYLVWTLRFTQTQQDADDLDGFCVVLMLVGTVVMMLVSATGLVASETSTGSISYLLGLPVSRTRIWWGKVLAGLALSALSAVLLVVPTSVALPVLRTQGHFTMYLPDMIAAGLCLYAIAVFCSTIFARPLTVFVAAPLITIGLFLATAAMAYDGKLQVLQYDQGMADESLWALVLTPVFLFASWVTFTRGELLDSRRRWQYAFPALVGGLAAAALVMVGAAGWLHMYRRGSVYQVAQISCPTGGRVASLVVLGSRAMFARNQDGWRWGGEPRTQNTVLVDLETRRDVMRWKGERMAEPSRDGRLVACVMAGGDPGAGPADVQVQEVPSGRARFSLAASALDAENGWVQPGRGGAWSPHDGWLALEVGRNVPPPSSLKATVAAYDRMSLLLFRGDGKVRREVLLRERAIPVQRPGEAAPVRVVSPGGNTEWAWVPGEEALYLANSGGEFSRYDPAAGTRTVMWRRPGASTSGEQLARRSVQMGISRDGRRAAVRAPEVIPDEHHAARSRTWVLAVEQGRVRQLVEFTDSQSGYTPLVWSGDSRTLYVGAAGRWQEGEQTSMPLPDRVDWRHTYRLVSFGSGMLAWGGGNVRSSPFIDAKGTVRQLRDVYPKAGPADQPVGTDAQGRLILQGGSGVGALDPKTGEVTVIYP